MKKYAFVGFICIYFILTIFITYILLSYNKYNVASIGNSYIVSLNTKIDKYDENDLLIVKKSDVNVGDFVLYSDSYNLPLNVKSGNIKDIKSDVIVLDTDVTITSENIIGSINNIKSYNYIGYIYSLLISKWGYLAIIIFPILIAFVYEIFAIIKEVRK